MKRLVDSFGEYDCLRMRSETHCLLGKTEKAGLKRAKWDFSGGTVVKNPSSNAGDMGLIPGPGRSHMPGSN